MLILVAIQFFYRTRQYEMEKKIAYLEKEKNALLMRDYQLLKDTYAANAKLFHDFHNHIEALYRYTGKGQDGGGQFSIWKACVHRLKQSRSISG